MDSSLLILSANSTNDTVTTLPSAIRPEHVSCQPGVPSVIRFSNGVICEGHCICCHDLPCMNFSKDELKFADDFKGFTPDHDTSVCPTAAISFDKINGIPSINQSTCVMCGCCASRCPTRAIYYENGTFKIKRQSSSDSKPYSTKKKGNLGPEFIEANKAFSHSLYEGSLINESDALINKIYSRLTTIIKRNSKIPNLLSRNLLLVTGVHAANSRCGDVYSRTDILFSFAEKQGLCEVEFNDTMIDTPRDIIEDIAIYKSRYNYSLSTLLPLIIALQYPNRRSEFWEVLDDIQKILNISIRTLTVGALLLLVWHQKKLTDHHLQLLPIVGNNHKEIRSNISSMLGRSISLGRGLLYNVLEPSK